MYIVYIVLVFFSVSHLKRRPRHAGLDIVSQPVKGIYT